MKPDLPPPTAAELHSAVDELANARAALIIHINEPEQYAVFSEQERAAQAALDALIARLPQVKH